MNKERPSAEAPHSNPGMQRAAQRLRVYELERLSYTDAANIPRPPRRPWLQRLQAVLHALKRFIR